jgi:isoquinoline 1-oxidoreductase alpha subunit
MEADMVFTLNVNGKDYTVDTTQDQPLLWVLRDLLGLTGTKYGCGITKCWACCVLVDGELKRSCVEKAYEDIGKKILTIEALETTPVGRALQQAWIEKQVPQCGYCQSGMLMTAAALLARKPKPTDKDIATAMTNLCVCGTYLRVRDAIHRAAGN